MPAVGVGVEKGFYFPKARTARNAIQADNIAAAIPSAILSAFVGAV